MTQINLAPELLWRLLSEHGSPLLVGSRSFVRHQFQCLREYLPSIDWFFAVKSNCDTELLQTLAIEGCGFDVASFSELEQVKKTFSWCATQPTIETLARFQQLKAHNPDTWETARILHSHPCKSPADIEACYQAGQRRFVFDCENELVKLAMIASQSRLLIRLNVRHGSGQVAFAHRFGADLDSVVSLARRSREHGMPIDGIAFHVGSQSIDPSDFDVALKVAREAWNQLHAAGIQVSLLDIGGGFPVAYRDKPTLSLASYCRSVGKMIEQNFGDARVKIIAEPGRVLCAEAVSLVTTVIGKQRRQGKLWYTIDDGRYGTFSGRYFSESTFNFFPHRKPRDEVIPTTTTSCLSLEPSMIAGPSCDGGDIVASDYLLPDLEIGDAIVVPNMGAYSSVSASEFNGIPKAKHVWMD